MADTNLPPDTIDFRILGLDEPTPRRRVGTPRKLHTFRLTEDAYIGLQFLAGAYRAEWGGRPSVNELLEMIGTQELRLVDPHRASKAAIMEQLRKEFE